ncbi:hypothetical protein PIB30_033341 [Stylosanthes scabra]|uniref:Uncharacterized protein n=1 Tax=Stylosanthes scabra TaxID=79078 RepID=A0ABU6WCP2_9FABA|nr:hypothetical protein [Stylosanthes scabra]
MLEEKPSPSSPSFIAMAAVGFRRCHFQNSRRRRARGERETRRRRKKVPPWLQLRVVVVPNCGFTVAVGGGAVNDQDAADALFSHRTSSCRKRCHCYRNLSSSSSGN